MWTFLLLQTAKVLARVGKSKTIIITGHLPENIVLELAISPLVNIEFKLQNLSKSNNQLKKTFGLLISKSCQYHFH